MPDIDGWAPCFEIFGIPPLVDGGERGQVGEGVLAPLSLRGCTGVKMAISGAYVDSKTKIISLILFLDEIGKG